MAGTRKAAKQRNPSFFKVLMDDFKTELRIPEGCIGSFGTNKSAILTHFATENSSWEVPINKNRNGDLRFHGNGWADFVNDNVLSTGDLLTFTFEGDARLVVHSFGKTSCLKTPKAKSGRAHKSRASHFEVTFARFNLFGLFVPREFVAETGMQSRKGVVVKDWEGREWPVTVMSQRNGGTRLGDGWGDFVRQNALQVGMTCVFQSLVPAADDDTLVLLAYPCDITLARPI